MLPKTIRAPGKIYLGMGFYTALGEGLLVGLVEGWMKNYIAYPLFLLSGSFYTCWRAGYIHRGAFLLSLTAGLLLSLFFKEDNISFAAFSGAVDSLCVSALVILSYYLFLGAHIFATYSRTWRSWLVTVISAVAAGVFIIFTIPIPPVIILAPMLWLCLLPIWCSNLRVFHSVLFAMIYLLTIYFLCESGLALPGRMNSSIFLQDWSVWLTTMLTSLIPELFATLYPERRHKLDSFPVITPTLSFWQKIKALKEVFYLAVDFYGLVMEKYRWFSKAAPYGRLIAGAGILTVIYSLICKHDIYILLSISFILFTMGVLCELGIGHYNIAAYCFVLYGFSLAIGNFLLSRIIHPGMLIPALTLVLSGVFIRYSSPKGKKAELERLINLNRLDK